MDPTLVIMWVGFILAGYSVVGNDSIQTLGTFLSSNEQRAWYVLWMYAGSILAFTLLYGWYHYSGDVSYGRLQKYAFIENMTWPYLLPPLVLMLLTRSGIPVSTSFLILTFFKPSGLYDMTMKSILGYVLAFALAILVWQAITKLLDRRFIENPITPRENRIWTVLQWCSTGFLWGQWLIQDFANIFVYLPRGLTGLEITLSLTILLLLLGYIFYSRGGSIQEIVKAKTNTVDIRSATLIDFLYALILLFFKEYSNVPMSTTWVFLGLLAGREIAIRYQLGKAGTGVNPTSLRYVGMAMNAVLLAMVLYIVYLRDQVSNQLIGAFAVLIIIRAVVVFWETNRQGIAFKGTFRMVGLDLGKITFGLVVSIALVYIMKYLTAGAVG
ncbi:MAG: hypothetical protein DA408_03920 [Bacteroidetes bacterium]|nr:MAG: hypothetical protein C7N36_08560 [Bacteroidota bacterium]PTM14226.1 MAG: hypothetical protein DA408_03920 [Bacteroidota bacterium]